MSSSAALERRITHPCSHSFPALLSCEFSEAVAGLSGLGCEGQA